jgi:hypothetical protein
MSYEIARLGMALPARCLIQMAGKLQHKDFPL